MNEDINEIDRKLDSNIYNYLPSPLLQVSALI